MPQAAFYGRVSTDKQDASLGDQSDRARTYAAGRPEPIALDDKHCFTDPDTSGGIPFARRPGASALRREIEANPAIRHLIVTKLDRIGRDLLDGELTLRWLDERGVILHVIDMGGDSFSTAGHFGRFFLRIIFAMAEWDRANIRGNIRTAIRSKRQRGEVVGQVPFGWSGVPTGRFRPRGDKQVEIRQLVEHEEEQRWLRWIIRARAPLDPCTGIAGGQRMSYGQIERTLNQHGVPRRLAPETADTEPNSLAPDPAHPGSPMWSGSGGAAHHILHNTFTAEIIAQMREADTEAEPTLELPEPEGECEEPAPTQLAAA